MNGAMKYLCPVAFYIAITASLAASTVIAGPKTLAVAWNDNMADELEASYDYLDTMKKELERIDREVAAAQKRADAGGDCGVLDCKALEELALLAAKADAASRASELLGLVALEQGQRLADNTKGVISAIRKGRDHLQNTLFYQEVALAAGELSLGIVASIATGNPVSLKGSFTSIASKIIEAGAPTAANFGVNKVIGSVVGDKIAGLTPEVAGSRVGKDVTSSIASHLTSFGGIDISNNRFTFTPKMAFMDLANRKTVDLPRDARFRALRSLPNVVDMTLNAVLKAATSGSINRTKEDVVNAQKELRNAMNARFDYILTAATQKLYVEELKRLRRTYLSVKDRLDGIRDLCNQKIREQTCGKALAATLHEAKTAKDKAIGAADAQRQEAVAALTDARAEWSRLMRDVNAAHLALRSARDGLSETELLESNREKIAELAKRASSASVRAKYSKELDDLNARKPLAEQKRYVQDLETRRAALWDSIEKQRGIIDELSQTAQTKYAQTDDVVDRAERVFHEAAYRAQQESVKCLSQREDPASAQRPSLGELRRATLASSLIPYDIFKPVNASFKALKEALTETSVRTNAAPGSQCEKISAARPLDGCWYDVSKGNTEDRTRPVTIATSGNRITVDYRKTNRRFAGTINGDEIKISYPISGAAELGQMDWWGRDGSGRDCQIFCV